MLSVPTMNVDNDLPEPPPGVRLRDPEDSDGLRKDIEDGVSNAMQRYVHGFEYGGVRLELGNVKYADKDRFSLAEQKEALLSDRALSRRLRGDVRLIDAATNEVIDERKGLTLARVPYLTQRGTFIHNGSEYSPINQSRLLPGAYARKRDNGEIEVHFNTRPGTGSAMRVTLDPVTAQYRLKIGSSNLHAYSVFKDLGVTDEELERRWGKQVLEINRAKYSKDAIDRAYAKAIPKWLRVGNLTRDEKATAIREALGKAQAATTILRKNLPNLYDREKAASWRRVGHALESAYGMEKQATVSFNPDLSPAQMVDSWYELDFGAQEIDKQAAFDPDMSPEDMRESYNSIYGGHGPQLASMKSWPAHWLDDQDGKGWLEWYENWSNGRRGDTDERQIARWLSFKKRHGAQFAANPTPRRAYALKNWAIDPIKLLPDDPDLRQAFQKKMDGYRGQEYMRWYMSRHFFDDGTAEKLVALAKARGADAADNSGKTLMRLSLEGYLRPEDLR